MRAGDRPADTSVAPGSGYETLVRLRPPLSQGRSRWVLRIPAAPKHGTMLGALGRRHLTRRSRATLQIPSPLYRRGDDQRGPVPRIRSWYPGWTPYPPLQAAPAPTGRTGLHWHSGVSETPSTSERIGRPGFGPASGCGRLRRRSCSLELPLPAGIRRVRIRAGPNWASSREAAGAKSGWRRRKAQPPVDSPRGLLTPPK